MNLPVIIQGGMGIAVSNWRLANAVAKTGQLGVVSSSAISRIFTSRLLDGDLLGNLRRALSNFSLGDAVKSILDRYFIPGGKSKDTPYRSQPVYTINPSKFLDQLTVMSNFAEVFLAKENHSGVVGINLLEKVQMPTLASLYGAMLAGVDFVLMGAGIPTQVAAILDRLSKHQAVSYRLDVQGAEPGDNFQMHFDPEKIFPGISKLKGELKRPKFLPVVSSIVLAQSLLRRSEGSIDGFIFEGHTAGGHNAPPRGTIKQDSNNESLYGEKDFVTLEKMKQLGLPFWLAGGYGNAEKLKLALEGGAAGVQVGTAFSLCNESGMTDELKNIVLKQVLDGKTKVFTSPTMSPTGFPFKVAFVEGTITDKSVYDKRTRVCDLNFLRSIYRESEGIVNYRCPAEPVDDYIRKGGKPEDTIGRTCLCNNLASTAGFAQIRANDYVEPALVTSGDDLPMIRKLISPEKMSYSASDVVNYLLDPVLKKPV